MNKKLPACGVTAAGKGSRGRSGDARTAAGMQNIMTAAGRRKRIGRS
jgi:hypothetical protein